VFVLCGLGNPGSRYCLTRHNAGFMVLDRIALRSGRRFRRGLSQGKTCLVDLDGQELLLVKPTTFMNRSGRAVRELLERFPVQLSDLLIVYDEVALPLGKIRLRSSGSAGGHKGMKSILEILNSRDISRLRIGVAGEEDPIDLADYVLSNFHRQEMVALDEVLDRAIEAIEDYFRDGTEKTMARFN